MDTSQKVLSLDKTAVEDSRMHVNMYASGYVIHIMYVPLALHMT